MTQDLNIRIVRALSYHGDGNWNYHGIMHPYNTVYFVTGGDGHICLDGKATEMLPGYVYLIPPHLHHDIWCDTHVEKVYVDVHVELLPGYDVFSDTRAILCQQIGQERCMRMHTLCEGGIRERLMLRGELNLVLAGFMQTEPEPVSAKMAAFRPMHHRDAVFFLFLGQKRQIYDNGAQNLHNCLLSLHFRNSAFRIQ